MRTFQGMKMHIDSIVETIRRDAIDDTIKQFEEAARVYYTQGYDNGDTVRLIKQLEELGVDQEAIFELDWKIREECAKGGSV